MWGLRENVLLVGDDSSFMMVAEDEDPGTLTYARALQEKNLFTSVYFVLNNCVCVF